MILWHTLCSMLLKLISSAPCSLVIFLHPSPGSLVVLDPILPSMDIPIRTHWCESWQVCLRVNRVVLWLLFFRSAPSMLPQWRGYLSCSLFPGVPNHQITLDSEIDQIHLSTEAQCGSPVYLVPMGDHHSKSPLQTINLSCPALWMCVRGSLLAGNNFLPYSICL